ncbi:thioredoxin family protein [Romeria aff. gracilis LEGE 07310]|uniref:Thioredoxin family protein n=1 Tax=Vasconcelosia minhoensis LEGE 07310 TaxID=915328 RepID=A0A8J7ABZ1_9CYAN|nr:thioredoxin family protein [Romeria gracilis]MBE9076829.1 thioredoxin family protein [Romeria aff. gracilis LEGE 07310]
MVMTESTMLPLGTVAPDFQLTDVVTGDSVSPAQFADKKGLLVMFICQHCPFVKHVEQQLGQIGRDYEPLGLGIVAISANSVETHPQDGPEQLREQATRLGFNFPYCYDETQAVAKTYTAACTPDFFLFDANQKLVYRGQLDASRPGNDKPVDGADLRQALDAVIAMQPVAEAQKPSIGCNIKWHPGQEPAYFGA